eukprot:GDKI01047216.1.p1 GENE.GDKI01047216.1~~GDKI01047216.1.p1  ORF type:complete len:437 (-),score=47.04 GDKI01047216.1:50-1360(-)
MSAKRGVHVVSPPISAAVENESTEEFLPSTVFLKTSSEVYFRYNFFPKFVNKELEEAYNANCIQRIYSEITTASIWVSCVGGPLWIAFTALTTYKDPQMLFAWRVFAIARLVLGAAPLMLFWVFGRFILRKIGNDKRQILWCKQLILRILTVCSVLFYIIHILSSREFLQLIFSLTPEQTSEYNSSLHQLVLAIDFLIVVSWFVKHSEILNAILIFSGRILYGFSNLPFQMWAPQVPAAFMGFCVCLSLNHTINQREVRASFLRSVLLRRHLETITMQQHMHKKLADRQKKFFLKVTHELRTPLNSILYSADAAREELTALAHALTPASGSGNTHIGVGGGVGVDGMNTHTQCVQGGRNTHTQEHQCFSVMGTPNFTPRVTAAEHSASSCVCVVGGGGSHVSGDSVKHTPIVTQLTNFVCLSVRWMCVSVCVRLCV